MYLYDKYKMGLNSNAFPYEGNWLGEVGMGLVQDTTLGQRSRNLAVSDLEQFAGAAKGRREDIFCRYFAGIKFIV